MQCTYRFRDRAKWAKMQHALQPPVILLSCSSTSCINLPLTNKHGNATEVKVLNYNETVEIVFQDTNVLDTSMNHPIHLHGYSFYVVGTGYGNFNNGTDPDS
ncbi:hypothetical protein ACSBR2_008034 [Camellia fascicularis]